MNNFSDMLSQAKKMQEKMKQIQENLKNIEVEGISGGNTVKVILKGNYEMKSIFPVSAVFNCFQMIGKIYYFV